MPQPDLILHIGAGLCSELSDYQQVESSQVVLIEPNPETCAELQAQAAGWDNVTVLQAAVTDGSDYARLRLFNFPELDSLREPKGLYSLLPGLRQVGWAEVSTLSAKVLIEQLPLKADGHNWLVLEAPGEELTILAALADCRALERFSHLIVRTGSEAFYDSTSSSSQAVLEALKQRGYTVQARPDTTDADWPRHHLRMDRKALECTRLKAEMAEAKRVHEEAAQKLQEELTQAWQKHKEALAQAEQAQQMRSQEVQGLESALTEQKTASEELETELHECKKDLGRLTQARDDAQQKLTEAQQKDTQRCKRFNQLEAALAKKTKQVEEFQAAQQSYKQELASAKDQRTKLTEQVEALKSLGTKKKQTQQQLEQVTQSRDNLQKQLQKHSEEAHKLKIYVSQLEEENEDYQERHKLLEEELVKAEAQIDLIKQLFLDGDDALDFDDEPEKN